MLNFLFPQYCVMCQSLIEDTPQLLCCDCLNELDLFDIPTEGDLLLRPDIKKFFKNPEFDHLWAISWYQEPFKTWLTQFKFHNQIHLKNTLQYIVKQQYLLHQSHLNMPDLALIVPLHHWRLITRGYNQVEQIWREVLAMPISSALVKTRATKMQSGLSKKQRQQNLHTSFSLAQNVEGLHVVIIDDVITTGTTVNHIARLAREKGAKEISVWTICITPLNQSFK